MGEESTHTSLIIRRKNKIEVLPELPFCEYINRLMDAGIKRKVIDPNFEIVIVDSNNIRRVCFPYHMGEKVLFYMSFLKQGWVIKFYKVGNGNE